MKFTSALFQLCCFSMFSFGLFAQVPAKLIQYPDVSESQICFTYGNDLWLVDKTGGNAMKLSSPIGRETFPKFSPDGKTIAFNANYDGNNDIYTLSTLGGMPTRVTGHGMSETLMDWYSDGEHLLYSSSSESGKQRFSQFYKIPISGGLADKLPIQIAAFGNVSADGSKIAFTEKSRVFRNWKRYRGGTAPDIYIMDLNTLESENITNNDANDELPMWHGDKLFYLTDNDENYRNNIWVYDTTTKEHKQLTNFTDFDVHFPSIGPSDMVFEAGGKLYLMDLATYTSKAIEINAIGDFEATRKVSKSTSGLIFNYNISPDGNRAVVEARGDIYSLPKKEGVVKNITRSSNSAERYPEWSPDGKKIVYWSDASGEYELTLQDVKSGKTSTISNLGAGYRYNIHWSPDSKSVVFIDQSMTFYVLNINTKQAKKIDQDIALFEGGLRGFDVSWSPDSKWISYSKTVDNGHEAVFLYNTKTGVSKQVTSGFYNDMDPSFGTEGDYLFLMTNRSFNPIYSDFDNTWVYPNATQLAAISLRKDVASPLAPKNDDVEIEEEEPEKEAEEKSTKKAKKKKKKKEEEKSDEKEKEDEVEPVKIDLDGLERRMVILPPSPGNYSSVSPVKGKLIYQKYPNSGSGEEKPQLMYFDLEEQESKTIISGINGYEVSANGEKILVRSKGSYGIIDVASDQSLEDQLPISDMVSVVDPRAEWKQMFNDAWRFTRDMFYDNEMHGVDWQATKEKYEPLVDHAQSRYDLNFILGELIAELNASHTYKGGGDQQYAKYKNTGYLGVDWSFENGAYRVKNIIKAAEWDTEVRSPLDMPGVAVHEGDYVLEVNGIPLVDFQDPYIAFAGMAGKTVELTVNKTNSITGSKKVLVVPIRSETRLRNLAWIESNRKKVDEMSNGRIGYIYVPSTGWDGQKELTRMFYGQWNKEGLIIDERFNNGGQIPDRFVELLNRKPLAYFDTRDGEDWQWPPIANFGAKAMLINGWSGSGGDAFPDYFKKSGLGPLIGTRTWGGVIGISGAPTLIDGGGITVPTFRMYDPQGKWFAEGHGVEPDIEVKENPTALAKGQDVQLERAIEEVLKSLDAGGAIHPKTPSKEDRSK